MHSRCVGLLLLTFLSAGVFVGAQNGVVTIVKPISQDGLAEALRIGGLTNDELVDIVRKRGVAFQLNEQVESDLRTAGALTPLIEAVRANYRPPAAPQRATPPTASRMGPLAKNEILTLLQVGTPSPRIAPIVEQRGVDFSLTPAITDELTSAGADSVLLTAIESARASTGVKPAATAQVSPAPATPNISSTPQVGTMPITPAPTIKPKAISIRDVHKLYVEQMNNNLDEYLRAEISRQLSERFQVVMTKESADALLVGTGEQTKDIGSVLTGGYLGLHDRASGAVSMVDQSGTVLWSSEAGDRTLLFGPLTRGGPREVASRLVQNLRRFVEKAN